MNGMKVDLIFFSRLTGTSLAGDVAVMCASSDTQHHVAAQKADFLVTKIGQR